MRRRKLNLECLEDRFVPSGFNYWTNADSDHLWSNPDNWSQLHVPYSNETAVFDDAVSNSDCVYNGIGGQIANKIKIAEGYTSELSLTSTNPIDLYWLEQWDGHITQETAASDIETDNWEWYGGSINVNTTALADVKVNDGGTFLWNAINKTIGSSVTVGLGASGTIDLPSVGDIVYFKNGAGITNDGNIYHYVGNLFLDAGETASTYSGYINNRGYYFATGVALDWTYVNLPFENTDSAAVFKVSTTQFKLGNAGSRDASLKQTAGTIQLTNSAYLGTCEGDTKTDVLIQGGVVETLDGSTCEIHVGGVGALKLSNDARIKVAVNTTIAGGTFQVTGSGRLYLYDDADILVRVKYVDGIYLCDAVQATRMTIGPDSGDTPTLTVQTVNFPQNPQTGLSFTVLSVTGTNQTIQGEFDDVYLGTGLDSYDVATYSHLFKVYT